MRTLLTDFSASCQVFAFDRSDNLSMQIKVLFQDGSSNYDICACLDRFFGLRYFLDSTPHNQRDRQALLDC